MEIAELLRLGLERKASDVHLLVPYPPILRINGRINLLKDWTNITPEISASAFQAISTEAQREIFARVQELDFSYETAELGRFRVNASYQRNSISLVFRAIQREIPTIAGMGLPEVCKALVELPRGLILVTGPTGSGKSTTLAAMLNHLNEHYEKKIITVEDPVEFVHRGKKCAFSQRELGNDTDSFASALRHILRQDPDVIMIGEMRDLETMHSVLTAAETGHLVLSTLHTRGAVESLSRVVEVFPGDQQEEIRYQMADVLEGVISQVLLRRADGKGRVAAFEVMIATTPIRTLIRNNTLNQIGSFLVTGQRVGMRTLDQDIERLLTSGVITLNEALAKARKLKTPQTIAIG